MRPHRVSSRKPPPAPINPFHNGDMMEARRWMWVLWPSFLGACALEFVVFGLVDPNDTLHHLDWGRQAVYALGFLVFWAISAATATMVLWVSQPEAEESKNQEN
jgi:hypothetical protein